MINGVTKGTGKSVQFDAWHGVYDIELTVTDNDGATARDRMIITVTAPGKNSAPTAVISGISPNVIDSNGTGGELVYFDGSASTDPDNNIVDWAWYVNGKRVAEGKTAEATVPVGNHSVKLVVTDANGESDEVSQGLTVRTGSVAMIPGAGQDEDERIKAGMALWRKDDKKFGVGCWACHGPDFLDLAFVNFRMQEDIVHRGLVHLDEDEMAVLANSIDALRSKLNITPVDRNDFRPFQPGGEVLPGDTNIDRDAAFAEELGTYDLMLTNGHVDSLEKARILRDELLGNRALGSATSPNDVFTADADSELQHFNFRKVKIGIPLNRWSEDHRFGREHNTIADWITDHPQKPRDAAAQDVIFAAADVYLDNPTEENLARYIHALEEHTVQFNPEEQFPGKDTSGQLMRRKFLGAQLAIHMMRMELMHGDADYYAKLPAPVVYPTMKRLGQDVTLMIFGKRAALCVQATRKCHLAILLTMISSTILLRRVSTRLLFRGFGSVSILTLEPRKPTPQIVRRVLSTSF